jgi:hypothetical protein
LNAIHLLEANFDKINWSALSGNPDLLNAIHILEKHRDKIDWKALSENPSIFEIDVKQYNIDVIKKAHNIDYN